MGVFEDVSSFGGNPVYIIGMLAFALLGRLEQFLQLLTALVLLYIIVIPIRYFWFKPRPEPKPHNTFYEKFAANSLISLHTARATIFVFVIIAFLHHFLMALLLGALIPLVAATRVVLQKHFIEDTITGFLLGAGIALLVLNFLF